MPPKLVIFSLLTDLFSAGELNLVEFIELILLYLHLSQPHSSELMELNVSGINQSHLKMGAQELEGQETSWLSCPISRQVTFHKTNRPRAKSPLGKQGQKQEAQLQAPCKRAARKLGGESWSTRHRLEIPASSSRHNAKQISQRHEVTSPLLFLDIIKLLTSMQSHRNTSAELKARTPAGIAGMLIQRGEDLGFFLLKQDSETIAGVILSWILTGIC